MTLKANENARGDYTESQLYEMITDIYSSVFWWFCSLLLLTCAQLPIPRCRRVQGFEPRGKGKGPHPGSTTPHQGQRPGRYGWGETHEPLRQSFCLRSAVALHCRLGRNHSIIVHYEGEEAEALRRGKSLCEWRLCRANHEQCLIPLNRRICRAFAMCVRSFRVKA